MTTQPVLEAQVTAQPRTRRLNWRKYVRSRYLFGAALLAPAMALVALFVLYPAVLAVSLSFQQYDLSRADRGGFVGLANYAEMLRRDDFWYGLWLTAVFVGGYVVGCLGIGLITALLLNQHFRLRGLIRTLLLTPWAILPVAGGLVWVYMLDYQMGVVNYLLESSHLIAGPIGWLIEPQSAMFSVIAVSIWQAFPFATVTLLGGLSSISPLLYEAAKVDGASTFRRFWHVTLPGLGNVLPVLLILLTIWSLRGFVMIFIMTGGGPGQATETLVVQSYRRAFTFYQFSYGATVGTIVLAIALLLSALYLYLNRATQD